MVSLNVILSKVRKLKEESRGQPLMSGVFWNGKKYEVNVMASYQSAGFGGGMLGNMGSMPVLTILYKSEASAKTTSNSINRLLGRKKLYG